MLGEVLMLPIELDLDRADRVMSARVVGLHALARAGQLDPARDFRDRDLRGWDLAGQNLSGFDFTGADLRSTNISLAYVDQSTILVNTKVDEGVVPGENAGAAQIPDHEFQAALALAAKLEAAGSWQELVRLADVILPMMRAE